MDTNAELADMHLAYGAANCSGPAAQRLYAERYPMRRIPSHNFFARLHQSVRRILREQDMHPFHVLRVQTQQPEYYAPRVAFAQWYLRKCATNPLFPDEVLFSDEASFTREGISTRITTIFGRWRIRMQYDVVQHRFDFRSMYGPQVLPQFLRDEQISASTQQTMWFQHDGAPAHFSGDVRNYLMSHLVNSGSDVVVPCVSLLGHPTYHVLIFYFWCHMKSLVYDTPVDNAEELVARIAVAAKEIRNSEYSRMFGCPCVGDVRRALYPVEETSDTYFNPCTFCFFSCIIKTISHLRSLFFMVLLCTTPLQESISDPTLLYDFELSGCTLSS
ncbi:DUF4817 domain-containing protein [Trichonephila clavipes]|nr:DUF4817 domain-containing protein [Trichonephila clavipes]